jgi:AraC-like DNA-binding protein
MISKVHIPSYPLNQFINYFYYYRAYTPEHSIEKFLPDGNIQLIMELTDGPKYIYDNITLEEVQACRKVWFSGIRTEPITIPSGRDSEMIVIEFRKGKAFPFIDEKMHSLTNHVVDAEIVFKNGILELRERLLEITNIDEKLKTLEKNLLDYYLDRLKENPFVDFVISNILKAPSQTCINALYKKVGYTQKHIIKIFKDHVGISPKEFLRIIRFQKVINEIEQRKNINWSYLAVDCGFYDQSHFLADFKTFSGFTPRQYLNQKSSTINYIPVL